ncbi:hydantoinase/oxoprolinase family protein [Methanohalobium sp.]|uniref:hydantoinase/oxoprolinase family protein n=1 Tax=Methanohalobium sp. TaxID=2837493 RepID=UPI0025EB1B69|nr:hydantoinase/oxoprolinase family protein [Methanohalobium sp.]
MKYSLGIDAGGTYTDAVILRNSDEKIIGANKALTTYPDPMAGIKNAIDGLDESYLKSVKTVSVSTTLSTNSILEGTGFPVGLILIGDFDFKQELPTKHYIQVSGGHNHKGGEKAPLDIESIEDFVYKVKDKVSAFAISSFFSNRNPDHEEDVREWINLVTDHPVVCSHELSQDLGAFERAVTAFFNAQLIPVTDKFMHTVESEIKSRGMDANIFMLKCDGSVVGIKKALEKPIESIFSGPAASLVGGAFLTGNDSCAVIDVGGTSTDISVIYNSVPKMSDKGAVVGGWETKVKAINMETSAMGGDSHIWVKENEVNFGSGRVIPLCRAAVMYPDFLNLLKRNPLSPVNLESENYQPTRFFIKSGYQPLEIDEGEREIFDAIKDEPTSISEIKDRINKYPSRKLLKSLIKKRLVQPIGFTPTDALHVLGNYTERNVEAANIGADYLASLARMDDKYQFCKFVKQEFTKNMASNLVSFFFEGISKNEIRKSFDIESPVQYKINIPVVLIGGPVSAFSEDLKELIDADIKVPDNSSVGNAVGALSAKGMRRVEVLIRRTSIFAPGWDYYVFSENGRVECNGYHEALDYARKLGESIILDYMEDIGIDPNHIQIDMDKKEITPDGWETPMESRVVVFGLAKHGEKS